MNRYLALMVISVFAAVATAGCQEPGKRPGEVDSGPGNDGGGAGTTGSGGSSTGSGGSSGGAGGGGGTAVGTKMPPAVHAVFMKYCAMACHGGEWQDRAKAYTRIMGTTSMGTTPNNSTCMGMKRMTAGDGAGSLVVKKMLGTAGCGTRMPRVLMMPGCTGTACMTVGCTGAACVPAAEIMIVQQWITDGARPVP